MKPAGGPGVNTIDPVLLGTWKDAKNFQYVFALDFTAPAQADATVFFGGVHFPYRLENAGQALVTNNNTWYQRQEGAANSIVGRWRNDAGGEEWTLRTDGRCMTVMDGDPIVLFGTYEATATTYMTYEFRARLATQGNQYFLTSYFGYREQGSWALAGTTLTMTVSNGRVDVYQRV